ncbi:MAG: hypothetical protein ACXWVI_06305 [Methyloceanibacter sp.]
MAQGESLGSEKMMILDAEDAQRFIRWYSLLLLAIRGKPVPDEGSLVEKLVQGRAKLMNEPALLLEAKAQLAARFAEVDFEVVAAVESLEVRRWVYLRDTKLHSIFIDQAGDRAVAVVGLTDRLRTLLGGSGVYVETGLVRYCGRFVCDGLIGQVVWLGPNYRESFNERYRELKSAGRFYR